MERLTTPLVRDSGVLREAGWVSSERRASWVYYRIRPEAVERMRRLAGELAPV